MVSWQYGVPSAAVALTQKVDFYWQRERVGGSWVFVAGNLDNASVSAVDPGFPTGKGGHTIFCQNLRKLAHETQKKLAPIIPSMVSILGASCISKMSTTEIIYRHRGSQLLLLH